jgi:hypothetical protein
MNQNLAEILQKKQKESATSINWDERRDMYLEAVRQLYGRIETILAESIAKHAVSLHRRSKQLTENYIGTYTVEDLLLLVGDEQVRFSPRGRNIVGASGRVDVVGERGEAMLILQPDAQWGFVESRQPELRVAPLDETTFAEVLRIVMRG